MKAFDKALEEVLEQHSVELLRAFFPGPTPLTFHKDAFALVCQELRPVRYDVLHGYAYFTPRDRLFSLLNMPGAE